MKKLILISVLTLVLVFSVAAYNVDARLGVSWANARIKDPNTSSANSKGDAYISGLGVSLGTAVEYYNNSAMWVDVNFIFPGNFKFDNSPIAIPSNSYLFYSDISVGGAFTFDMNNLELYLGLGYSVCELFYRFDLINSRYREYSLSASGPAAYLAAKLDMGGRMSIQLSAVPKLTIYNLRVTKDKGSYYSKTTSRDFLFNAGFAVNASLSFVYTF